MVICISIILDNDHVLFKNINIKVNLAFSSKGIPVCETRVVRKGKGMPWDGRVAIHPLGDGKIELTPVEIIKLPPE